MSRMPEMPFTLECNIVYYSAIWMGDLAIFMPPDNVNDRGHIVFVLSVCLSVSVVNFNLRYNFRTIRPKKKYVCLLSHAEKN